MLSWAYLMGTILVLAAPFLFFTLRNFGRFPENKEFVENIPRNVLTAFNLSAGLPLLGAAALSGLTDLGHQGYLGWVFAAVVLQVVCVSIWLRGWWRWWCLVTVVGVNGRLILRWVAGRRRGRRPRSRSWPAAIAIVLVSLRVGHHERVVLNRRQLGIPFDHVGQPSLVDLTELLPFEQTLIPEAIAVSEGGELFGQHRAR